MSDRTEMMEVTCQICKEQMSVEVPPAAASGFAPMIRRLAAKGAVHGACAAAQTDAAAAKQAEAERDATAAGLETLWAKICPAEFRKEIDHGDPNCDPGKHVEVMRWTFGAKGLILAGPTGQCKTRFVFDLARRELFAGRELFVMRHPEWRMEASSIAADDQGKLRQWIHKQAVVPLWIMDDLGKGKSTDAADEALESLISQRAAAHKPMIFTTNDTAAILETRFSGGRGGPMVRRILQASQKPIKF
jgi:hypothetical protein